MESVEKQNRKQRITTGLLHCGVEELSVISVAK